MKRPLSQNLTSRKVRCHAAFRVFEGEINGQKKEFWRYIFTKNIDISGKKWPARLFVLIVTSYKFLQLSLLNINKKSHKNEKLSELQYLKLILVIKCEINSNNTKLCYFLAIQEICDIIISR